MVNTLIKKPNKDRSITIKVSPQELTKIRAKADKFVGGNVSYWLRYAAIRYKPNVRDEQNDTGEMRGTDGTGTG